MFNLYYSNSQTYCDWDLFCFVLHKLSSMDGCTFTPADPVRKYLSADELDGEGQNF